jgi:hypothetical protein
MLCYNMIHRQSLPPKIQRKRGRPSRSSKEISVALIEAMATGLVHRQRLWDQIGDLSYGGFLAHRNPKESEDEPEILRLTRPCAS